VIDLFTRKAVGYSMSESMPSELLIAALDMVLKRHGITTINDLTTNTNRGSQYASKDYHDKTEEYKIVQSMSCKGNCYDNDFIESFFLNVKS
jgi:putative transposase